MFHVGLDSEKNGGELEINQTKASVGRAVGHIARVGVVVAHAEFFQFGKQFLRALFIQVFHAAAAIRRDDAEFFFVGFKQSRDEIAAARFEKFQDAHFIFKPLFARSGRDKS